MADVSIDQALNGLSQKNVTVYSLKALDFVVPGEWTNITNYDDMIKDVIGESDPSKMYQISVKSRELFADENNGFKRALWLYQATDKADFALGSAAMADKVGERIQFLSFLSRFTPQADTTQAIDLSMKIVVELLAFCFMHGLPRDREGISRFAAAVKEGYRQESVMRMAALVCLDGIIPLGPDFISKVGSTLGNMNPSSLNSNPLFGTIGKLIPGSGEGGKLGFITNAFDSMKDWMNNLLQKRGLTTEKVTASLKKYVEFTDDKLDYLAAFFDMSTNYYAHTGTQTVARTVIQRAVKELEAPGQSATTATSMPPMSEFMPAAPPPPTGDTKPAQAVYDYLSSSPGYLSISKGEALTIIGDERGGWYQARNAAGGTGYVPVSYVKLGGGAQPAPAAGPRRAILTGNNEGSSFQAFAGEGLTITGEEKNGWYWGTNDRGLSGWVQARLLQFE